MPINYKLLKRIQKSIAKEPRRLEMGSGIRIKDKIAPCGTTACIAGHAVIYSLPQYRKVGFKGVGFKLVKESPEGSDAKYRNEASWRRIKEEASRVLKLNQDQVDRLFYSWNWPDPFHTDYKYALTRKNRAKIAIARIQRFIDTKGQE